MRPGETVLDWQLTPYTPALVMAVGLSTGLAGYAIHRLRAHAGSPTVAAFAVLMVGTAVWSFGDTMQVTSTSLGAKVLWRTVAYVGHNVGPVTLLAFALLYAGYEEWVSRRTIGLLTLEPLAVAAVVTPTNPTHGLMWPEFHLADLGGFLVLERSFGVWYWVNTAYNYLLVIAAIAILARMCFGWRQRLYRRQAALIGGGVMLPFAANVAWVTKTTPVDLTAVAFAGMGLLFAVAVFRLRLLNLLPVARDAVVTNMRDGVVVLNADDEVVDLNPAATELLGLPEDAIGRAAASVIPSFDALAAKGEEGPTIVDVGEPTDPRHVEASVSHIGTRGVDGRILLLHDVTERRRLERRSRALVQNATDAILVMDPSGEVTYASPSTAEVLGYEPEEYEGRDALALVHPEDRQAVDAALATCMEETGGEASIEYRYRHGDGSWLWLDSRGKNLVHEPAVGGVVVHTRDVTDRKARERALKRQNERLEEFGSVLSHDLRNPLNVAQGYLDMLDGADEDDVEVVEDSLSRMERIIEDLQTMTRYGREITDRERVDLAAVAREAWNYVETNGATVSIESGGGGDGGGEATVDADPDRLLRLFENLFRNAVEHAGPAVSVTVETTPNGFAVVDDGPGIPEENRERVFQSGHTTAETGTGFGLAIVRQIAESHGWEVAATTADAGGARIEVTGVSKLARPEEPAAGSETGTESGAGVGTGTGTGTG